MVAAGGGGTANGVAGFTLIMSFRDADTGDQIAFKHDGGRFETSQRTLKFCSDTKYKISFKCTPAVEFHNLHIAGSDLELRCDGPARGEYDSVWNTTGINPTKKGARQDLVVVLKGPGGMLKKTLQSKFYQKAHSHADWGHKLDSLQWTCTVDPTGNIAVTNEEIR
uniref:CB1 cannabinoid receptor-interacting protein 1 n=1 Tax=Panagrellus redivivus TaxID=6233 RepID=A0A7E4W3E5_PANRE